MAALEAMKDLGRNPSNRRRSRAQTAQGADPSFCRPRSVAALGCIRLRSRAPRAEIGRPGDRRDQHNEKEDLHGVPAPLIETPAIGFPSAQWLTIRFTEAGTGL